MVVAGRPLPPAPGLGGVVVFEQEPEVVHGVSVIARGRPLVPAPGFGGVAVDVQDPKVVHGVDIVLLGQREPGLVGNVRIRVDGRGIANPEPSRNARCVLERRPPDLIGHLRSWTLGIGVLEVLVHREGGARTDLGEERLDRAARADLGVQGPFQGLLEFAAPGSFAERDSTEGSGQIDGHGLPDAGRVPVEYGPHQGVPDRVVFVVPGGLELSDQLRAGHQPCARRSAVGHPGQERWVAHEGLDPRQLVAVPVPPAHFRHAIPICESTAERVTVATAGRQRPQLGLADRCDDERTSASQPIKGVRSASLVVSLEVVEPDDRITPVRDTEVFESGQTPDSWGKQESTTRLLANRLGRGARFASGRAADDEDHSAGVPSSNEGRPQCGVAVALDVVEVRGLAVEVGARDSEGAEVRLLDPEWGSVRAKARLLQHVSESLRVSNLDDGRGTDDLGEGRDKGR